MNENRASVRRNAGLSAISVVLLVVLLFPLYWIAVTSFKTEQEIFRVPPTLLPQQVSAASYTAQLQSGDFNMFRSFRNSFFISIGSMLVAVLLAVPASYGISRYRFHGRKLITLLFLVTQMLPVSVLLTPMFVIFKNLKLLNSPFSAIIADATISIPFSVLILRNYFASIPKDLEEAAYIDGCNRFMGFLRVLIPIAMPGVVVCAVFSFLYAWGDLAYGMTFIQDQVNRPITAGIFNFMGQYGTLYPYPFAQAFGDCGFGIHINELVFYRRAAAI